MLDNRLKLCVEMTDGSGTICDVGTDHAYLAVELIQSGKCKRVIASDIGEGPLEAAKRTVEKNNLSDKIELVLSDGLDGIPSDNVSDIVIAGMGGETIISILQKCNWIIDSNVNLVLQPMSKPEILRKWLFDADLFITKERVADDGDKLYTVMCARWDKNGLRKLTETEALSGFFDETDALAIKYRQKESMRFQKISEALEIAGKHCESVHYNSVSKKLSSGLKKTSINDIYNYLDSLYPFSDQEKWDNSGLLVNNLTMECSKILLTLDITHSARYEAECKGAELIISHHPIIFEPLKKLSYNMPIYSLVECGISAICMHTNLDVSKNGTNGVILKRIAERFELSEAPQPFDDCGRGLYLGWICELKNKIDAVEFGKILKEIFGCEIVKMNTLHIKKIKRFTFCSGSGGSMLGLAIEKGCDAYITGDVKHDVWIDANDSHISLFDCGHFHTENLVLEELRYVLEEKFPQLEVIIAESSQDPVKYIK